MSRPNAPAREPAEQVIHQDTSTPSDDLPITPLAPEAPAPVCQCSTSWEHRFWGCELSFAFRIVLNYLPNLHVSHFPFSTPICYSLGRREEVLQVRKRKRLTNTGPAKVTSSLREQNEPGGGMWKRRDEVWKGLLKGEVFSIEQLENVSALFLGH